MKLIKKIAAIMFALMMVVSMSSNVKADEGTTTTEKGKITINNAVNGQTYTIYKLLDLESYEPKKNEQGEEIGNYSYKPNKDWNSFISTAKDSEGINYFDVDENGYARWNVNETKTAEFAQKALAYATTNSIANKGTTTAQNNTASFNNLDLGYYLVDSSVGALCGLNTTNPTATIEEKNGVPSVEKKIVQNNTDVESNFANIGDTVYFQTTITAKSGAENYVLHDTMDKAFTFNNDIAVQSNGVTIDSSKYTIYYDKNNTENTNHVADGCTFEIQFTKNYLDTLPNDQKIVVTYSATLNENAVIAGEGNKNETWLKYGDSQSTQPVTTNTKTFEMNVFKFYEDKNNSNAEKGLAGAIFKLTKGSQDAENIGFVKTSNVTATDDVYRVAKKDETGTVTTITSPKSGKFTIQGLGAGTYYLTETKQPDGYNKLSGPVTVVIDKDGKVKVKNGDAYDEVTQVKVENKSGTVLPSTGGAGTTMIYLIGGALVLGSGVVLATKRRVKNK